MHLLNAIADISPVLMKILLIALVAVIAIGLILLARYYNIKNKITRKLKNLPEKRITSIKTNEYAKIIGKAGILDKTITAPISKRKCLYYQVIIEQQKSYSENQTLWKTIIEEEKYIPFLIESKGEKAIIEDIDPKNKMIYLVKDVQKSSGFLSNAPQELEDFLKTYGKKSKGLLGFNKTMRYTEGIIEVDEVIAVMGVGHWKKTDHIIDRYSSDTLHLYGDKKQKLIITDNPKVTTQKK